MTKPAKSTATHQPPWEAVAGEPLPINLEVRYQTGDGCFLPYAYLVYCRYDRSGTIELHFSSRVLRVEGRHLGALYAALNKHAVSFVQEGSHGENAPESEPFISELVVTESED